MASAAAVRLEHAAPQLPSADLGRTKAWYEAHLGFRELGRWQDWQFLILERDGVRLHFFPHDDRKAMEVGTFYLRVAGDIDALADRMKEAGVEMHDPPEDRPYGMREFVVHDPDGRHVLIGRPVEGA